MKLFVSMCVLATLVACSDKQSSPTTDPAPASPSAPAPATAAQSPADEARGAFNTLCSVCHGASGHGDGPAAASLQVKPRNYTDKAWQASITDDQIKKTIVEGGAAVGKSALMPPWTQFKDKPQVLDELVKIVRSFGK